MSEFPNVSLVVMHSNMNIDMDSNKRVHKHLTTGAFKNRTQTMALLALLLNVAFMADQLRTKDITPYKRTCSLLNFMTMHWCSFCNFSI